MLSNLTSVVEDSIRVWADFNWWISEFGFGCAVVSSGLLDCLRTLLRDQTDRSSLFNFIFLVLSFHSRRFYLLDGSIGFDLGTNVPSFVTGPNLRTAYCQLS